jgi:hypothetical protein
MEKPNQGNREDAKSAKVKQDTEDTAFFLFVIPAQAGIQGWSYLSLDPG